MKKFLFSLTALLAGCFLHLSAEPETPNPQAHPEAIVTSGRARFTVLTPQMIRIQYSTRQQFEDRATFAVINRELPVPQFTTREEGGYLYIETEALTLRYRIGAKYQLNRHNAFDLGFQIDDEMNVGNPEDRFMLCIGYKYKF